MFKDNRYINAGQNEIYRWGRKAVEKAERCIAPNSGGFINIPADGGKYWTIGTSQGRYGEFAKINGVIFSVNKAGNVWAKAGTEKGEQLAEAIRAMADEMKRIHAESAKEEEEE